MKTKKNTALDHEKAQWKLNSLILCRYLQAAPNDVYYVAKIMNITHDPVGAFVYHIHYQGWNNRHDEKILEIDGNARFKPFTPEAAGEAEQVIKEALQNSSSKRARRIGSTKQFGDLSAEMTTSCEGMPFLAAQSSVSNNRVFATSAAAIQRQLSLKRRGMSMPPSAIASQTCAIVVGKKTRKDTAATPLNSTNTAKQESSNKRVLSFMPTSVTPALVNILKRDHYLVKDALCLHNLPAKFTIYKIVQRYNSYLENRDSDAKLRKLNKLFNVPDSSENYYSKIKNRTSESANMQYALGVSDFFDVLLKSRLLYNFEVDQHNQYVTELAKLYADHEDAHEIMRMSRHYGLPHLLRLMVLLPEILAGTSLQRNRANISIVKYRSDRFIEFLDKNSHVFFSEKDDYKKADLTYIGNNIPKPMTNISMNNVKSNVTNKAIVSKSHFQLMEKKTTKDDVKSYTKKNAKHKRDDKENARRRRSTSVKH